MSQQVQIVLDSDVIIHFIKGNCLSILPKILPQYKYVILSIVYDRELSRDSSTKAQIDNQIRLLKNIQIIPWKPDCRTENITYLTTLDFLWYAKKNKVMTEKECNDFIQTVISKNSILPNISITIYTPTINFL